MTIEEARKELRATRDDDQSPWETEDELNAFIKVVCTLGLVWLDRLEAEDKAKGCLHCPDFATDG